MKPEHKQATALRPRAYAAEMDTIGHSKRAKNLFIVFREGTHHLRVLHAAPLTRSPQLRSKTA